MYLLSNINILNYHWGTVPFQNIYWLFVSFFWDLLDHLEDLFFNYISCFLIHSQEFLYTKEINTLLSMLQILFPSLSFAFQLCNSTSYHSEILGFYGVKSTHFLWFMNFCLAHKSLNPTLKIHNHLNYILIFSLYLL